MTKNFSTIWNTGSHCALIGINFNTECTNHPSAVNFPSDVDAYFRKETKHKAIVGPCENIPFPIHYSPLLSRPKEGDTRRIIVNMSFPYGSSVNDNISNNEYDGVDFQLRYPTVDDIVKSVQDLGNEVLLSKIDVSRAFRNLRVDPFEYDALGLTWDGKSYIDISIPMGMKTGSALCQRTTDVIRHVMQSKNVRLYNYIEDIICVHQRHNARQEFDALYSLFEFLGLPINPKKVVPPATFFHLYSLLQEPRQNCMISTGLTLPRYLTSTLLSSHAWQNSSQMSGCLSHIVWLAP